MDALEAHTTMSKQATDSEKVREGLKDVLLGPAQLYAALKAKGDQEMDFRKATSECGHHQATTHCSLTERLLCHRRMIAPDEQGKHRDRNADQRCADEEILETYSLDHEARRAR
jgi:hypothetical protein